MRTTKLITMTLFGLLFFSFLAFAGNEKADTKDEAKTETKNLSMTEKKGDTEVELKNQTVCPVMGGDIDSTVFTDIQGQRVYHCCPMCSKKLKKDPNSYFKKSAEEGILFENIQTMCPVSNEELEDKSVFADFEGRRVFFCCKKCRGTFNENPQEYIDKMDNKVEASEEKKDDGHDHSGHNH